MITLPTLRRRILRSFSLLLVLYAILGTLLLISLNIAGKTTPTVLHVNYDSISAAVRMNEAWSALQYPEYSWKHDGKNSKAEWIRQFEEALRFDEGNVTEPGEREIITSLRSDWDRFKPELGHLDREQFQTVRKLLEALVSVNEKGMFNVAQQNERLNQHVLIGALIYFAMSLFLSILFADQLAQRLSRPLKSIAETLHSRPSFSHRLTLPEPTNLELLILTTELKRLWERLSEAEKVNVAELVRQRNKLETLLESVEDALLVLDPDGRVSHCNEHLCKLVGLKKEEIQNSMWSDLPTLNENYLKLRVSLKPEMSDGQQLDLVWNNNVTYFAARSKRIGAHTKGGVVYLLHDITEKKQREKFRSEFIDLLSHELKTPLQSLGTASELLSAEKAHLNPDLAGLVDTIAEDVERLRALGQEFAKITQTHAKSMRLRLERVALNEVVSEWIKPFNIVAKDRGVRIEFQQEGSDVIWANLDPVKFPWVISNVLSNAVRFSPSGGVVTVLVTDRAGAVEVQIKDEGPGIPEAERGHIFEPFYQSAMATSSGARGLFGIGLTIAKEVVEAHDGRIEYYPLQPHGSEFRILLPFPMLEFGDAQRKGI